MPTNNPISTVDDILNAIINEIGTNAVILAAETYLPFLKLPVISTLFRWLVEWIQNQEYLALKGVVNFEIIKFQNDAEESAYNDALSSLQKAVLSGDANAISQARSQASVAIDKLINFNH